MRGSVASDLRLRRTTEEVWGVMGWGDGATGRVIVAVLAGLVALSSCTGSATVPETIPPTTAQDQQIVPLSDSALLWCSDNRWQVVVRAQQLGLALPAVSNPATDPFLDSANQRLDDIESGTRVGRYQAREGPGLIEAVIQVMEEAKERWESGEWHVSGVRDEVWADYVAREPGSFARSCQAAWDLRFDPPASDVTGERVWATTTTSSISQPTTTAISAPPASTTSTAIPTNTDHEHPEPSWGGVSMEVNGDPPPVSVLGDVDCSGGGLTVDVRIENLSNLQLVLYQLGVGYDEIGHALFLLDFGWYGGGEVLLDPGETATHHEHLDTSYPEVTSFPLETGDSVEVWLDYHAADLTSGGGGTGVVVACP